MHVKDMDIRQADIGIMIVDNDLRLKWFNEFFSNLYSCNIRELEGKFCYSELKNRQEICPDCVAYRAKITGEIQSGVYEREINGFGKKNFQIIATPIKDKDGNLVRILEITIDVTHQKNLEQKLKESENYYRTLFEHSGTAVCVVESNKKISKVNKKFEELSSYNREDIECKLSTLDVVKNKNKVEEIHELRKYQPEIAPKQYETIFIDKNGAEKVVEIYADAIPETGKIIASIIDVTQHKKLENEIKQKQELLTNILENSIDAIIGLDENYLINSWNKASEKLFCYQKEEILLCDFSCILQENFDLLKESLNNYGFIQDFETICVTKDKKEKICNINGALIKNTENKIIGSSLIIRDITEKKKLAERMLYFERMSALGELSASLAHEIKNPLNSMVINLEVLKGYTNKIEPDLKTKTEKYLKIMGEEIERLDKVIRGFLDFAKLTELIDHEASKKDIKIIKKYYQENSFVFGDETQLKQAMLNLFLNSIQAMHNGGILEIMLNQDGGNFIKIDVKDTGCGIAPDNQWKIFDLYFSTKEKGSGLGLAIVKKIIKTHNGYINFKSKLNEGTTFTITLPAQF